jgi:hypothetical protein
MGWLLRLTKKDFECIIIVSSSSDVHRYQITIRTSESVIRIRHGYHTPPAPRPMER